MLHLRFESWSPLSRNLSSGVVNRGRRLSAIDVDVVAEWN